MRSPCATSRPRSARRTPTTCAGIRASMSTFAEYSSWLVVEAAQGFGAATLAAKLLADLGCTVARLDVERDVAPLGASADAIPDAAQAADVALHELLSRGKDSV